MNGLIASSMNQVDGTLRVLFAAEAYGMGADAPDVRQVNHIGVPSSLDSKYSNILKHWQSLGVVDVESILNHMKKL